MRSTLPKSIEECESTREYGLDEWRWMIFGNEKPRKELTLEDTKKMSLFEIASKTNQMGELDITIPDPDARYSIYIDIRRTDEKYFQYFKYSNLYEGGNIAPSYAFILNKYRRHKSTGKFTNKDQEIINFNTFNVRHM